MDVISSSLDFDQLALLVLGNVKEVPPQQFDLKLLSSSGWKIVKLTIFRLEKT